MEQNRNIPAAAVFSLLPGLWRLSRTVDGVKRMDGVAQYDALAHESLAYFERGEHRVDGRRLDFYQAYQLRRLGDKVHVNFADGRPFHSLFFQKDRHILKADALHLCGNDTYRGEYVFHGHDRFTVQWAVRGPRKDYTIETRYCRQGTC